MQVTIDIDSNEPLFEQLVRQVKALIKSEALKPGDSLPSIRQLADDLGLNNKTVAKAFKLLERDSVIVTRGYRGTFVHAEALANCDTDIRSQVEETLGAAIAALRASGVTDSEIRLGFIELMKNG